MVKRVFATSIQRVRARSQVWSASILLAICASISPAQGADRELVTPRPSLDVVLVFDASGSMLKTDPNNLRYQGAKLLLSFLSASDNIGVVSFAGSAVVVRDLGPFSQEISGQVLQQIEGIKSEGPFSDLAEGLKAAKKVLDAKGRANVQRVIVLLSDGKMEPDPAVAPQFARTLELVHDVLPELKTKETKVFTLAFSDQADRPFLGEIAAATDGLTWYTASSQDIHRSFADLFLAIKRPQVVSQTSRGFKIEGDVEEATFYINRESGAALALVSPRGDEFTLTRKPEHVTWYSGQNFDVVTVQEPETGDWQVMGTHSQDGFATVLTDLKLLTDWPLVVRAGDEPLLQARLYEHDKPISLPEMSSVVTFAFQIVPTDKVAKPLIQATLSDDGKGADKVALDGIFSAFTEIAEPGAYKLTLVAKGPTFQRSQQIPFTARQRLVTLSVQSEDSDEAHSTTQSQGSEEDRPDGALEGREDGGPSRRRSGDDRAEFIVKLSKEAISFREFSVQLIATSSGQEKIEIPLKGSSASDLELSVVANKLPGAGRYTIKARLIGQTKKGEEVRGESQSIVFDYSPRVMTEQSQPTVVAQISEEPVVEEPARTRLDAQPLIPMVLVTLVSAVTFGVLYMLSKPVKVKGAGTAQKYLPHKQLIDAIASLEERISATRVELNDPIFSLVETSRSGGSVTGGDASGAADSTPQQEGAS